MKTQQGSIPNTTIEQTAEDVVTTALESDQPA
jgi:hypothetical protein